ncbi:hypothetical protein [Leisingera daeponensis]|uniref:hypothetical protein n=1 Tax=Leisingera daeponensis TaxID=405746 RepID=UPI001C952E90|nr:hypothetical protein [Leisingera daeponensis]MBY6055360.1 hypothetical protein [Leisingera daeponensis]
MSGKCVQWGYILVAPGRPSYAEQVELLRDLGISRDAYGPVWVDKISRGSTRPKSQLEERNDVLKASLSGDVVHVMSPICAGLSAADVRWFASEVLAGGRRLFVGGNEVSTDEQVSEVAGAASRAIGAAHVAENRKTGGKRRKKKEAPAPVYKKAPCVYRHFDEDGELLYIGACTSYENRERKHRSSAEWFPQIARVEFEYFDSLREAFAAERSAIWFENPKHNRMVAEPDSDAFIEKATELAMRSDPELAAKIRAMKPKSK